MTPESVQPGQQDRITDTAALPLHLDPAGERAYYALIEAGFDETDAERAADIVLKEVGRA